MEGEEESGPNLVRRDARERVGGGGASDGGEKGRGEGEGEAKRRQNRRLVERRSDRRLRRPGYSAALIMTSVRS